MSASPIVEEIDISGSGAYISSKIVESSLRKLLGRASGRTPPGRGDLASTNTADTRKVCRVWGGGSGSGLCWAASAATVESRGGSSGGVSGALPPQPHSNNNPPPPPPPQQPPP
ncbi:hypothetical protein OTU49_006570, partial [Cherax quadricarinatus]